MLPAVSLGPLRKSETAYVIGVTALAFVVRLLFNVPVYKYTNDADVLLTGIGALRILDGDVRVFIAGARQGAVECYLAAIPIVLFGASRLTHALWHVLLGTASIPVSWHFFRRAVSPKAARVALLLMALPTPFAMTSSVTPTYSIILPICLVIMWLTLRADEHPESRATWAALAFFCGIGIWTSLLTTACSVPAWIWLGWRHRGSLGRVLPVAVLGGAVGALPWIAFNVRYPLASFRVNYATQPVSGIAEFLSNERLLITGAWPQLFGEPAAAPAFVIPPLVAAEHVLVAAGALYYFGSLLWKRHRSAAGWFLLGMVVFNALLYGVSAAGTQTQTLTSRFILPLLPVMAAAVGSFIVEAGGRVRGMIPVLVAILLIAHVAALPLPGLSAKRREFTQFANDDAIVAERLTRSGVTVVVGNYWTVYPFEFLTRERVHGIPCIEVEDYYRVRDLVPRGHVRWVFARRPAAAVDDQNPQFPAGMIERVGSYVLFHPAEASSLESALRLCR